MTKARKSITLDNVCTVMCLSSMHKTNKEENTITNIERYETNAQKTKPTKSSNKCGTIFGICNIINEIIDSFLP